MCCLRCWSGFFFFNDTATTEIYTLSLTRRSSDLTLRLVITGASVSGFGVAVTSAACCFGLDRAVEVVCPLLGTRWDWPVGWDAFSSKGSDSTVEVEGNQNCQSL